MAVVQVVSADSPLISAVQRLWRANSGSLGFFPEGAFVERAQKGQILAAVDGNSVLGYVLYYTDKSPKVRVTHLCVDEAARGQGVSRQLIDELRSRTESCRGIGLYCRRDLPAWNMWPKFGFHAISEKVGRSKDGDELTYFWLEHPHRTLFSHVHDIDKDRLTVAIDANIFYDLIDPTRNGAEETQGLVSDWLQPLIQICVTQELSNEIHRNPNAHERKARMTEARKFVFLECETDDFHAANDLVKALLGEPQTPRDESDQRHLAQAIAANADVFVTRDGPLLDHADEVYQRNGLPVVRPSQLIARYEELRNERDYQRQRLAGTDIQTRRVSGEAEKLADDFVALDVSEKKWRLERLLNTALAHPDEYQCHYIATSDGKPLAMYVLQERDAGPLTVPVFRVSSSVLRTRLAGTLVRTLLTEIVQNALDQGKHALQVTEAYLNSVVTDALQDRGFFAADGAWMKLSLDGAVLLPEVASHIRETIHALGIDESVVADVLAVIEDKSFPSNAGAVLQIEHLLWPGKIIGTCVSNYVIPIRPDWATDLFDAGLAKGRLWGADTDLALCPDSVYYRAVKPKVLQGQGRILWYVSDAKTPGAKKIRACSQVQDVAIGQPKEVYRRYRRFGVYEWRNVLKTAGSLEGKVMAVQFTDTELFERPVDWATIQSILHRHGKRNTFPSPVRIDEEVFVDLYRSGIGESE